MSAHTKGPWQVHWEANVVGYPVYSIHGMSGDQKRDEATLNANARLIAAAPQLLALAQRYASECTECGGRGTFPSHREDPGGHSTLECWECADILEVIAKAEGAKP